MSPLLVINLWFKGKALWPTCLWMISVLISQVVLVELGSCLSWEESDFFRRDTRLNASNKSESCRLWSPHLDLNSHTVSEVLGPMGQSVPEVKHQYLPPLSPSRLHSWIPIFKELTQNNQLTDRYQWQWWRTNPISWLESHCIDSKDDCPALVMQLEKLVWFWAHNTDWRKGEEQESVPGEREEMIKHWNDWFMIKD